MPDFDIDAALSQSSAQPGWTCRCTPTQLQTTPFAISEYEFSFNGEAAGRHCTTIRLPRILTEAELAQLGQSMANWYVACLNDRGVEPSDTPPNPKQLVFNLCRVFGSYNDLFYAENHKADELLGALTQHAGL